jgi:hypothetical protein
MALAPRQCPAFTVLGPPLSSETCRLPAAEGVVSSLRSSKNSGKGGNADFVQCNVTEYADNCKLFKTAYDKYKPINHAEAYAGILEQGKWFDPELTIEIVEK